MRNKDVNSIVVSLSVWEAHGSGNNSAISRSNNKKVIATKKNFIEKGRRAEPMGSNPHSYGLDFSAYTFIWGSQNAIVTRSEANRVLIIKVNIKFIILSRSFPRLADWKSAVLINTKRIRSSSINGDI